MKCNDHLQLIETWTLNYNNTFITKKKHDIHLALSLKKATVTYYYLYLCQTIEQTRKLETCVNYFYATIQNI